VRHWSCNTQARRVAALCWNPVRRKELGQKQAPRCSSYRSQPLGLDVRFVVTSLTSGSAEYIYDTLYCARGQAENLIKLHKSQFRSDWTSCRSANANQMRIILHTAAYELMWAVRQAMPATNPLRNAEFSTLRLRLLKVAARVVETASRIRIAFATGCTDAALFRSISLRLRTAGPWSTRHVPPASTPSPQPRKPPSPALIKRTLLWAAAGPIDTRLSCLRLPLEVHGAEIAQGRVPARRIVKALDMIDTSAFAWLRIRYVFRPIRSVFIDEKKLSITALSQTLPDRLIEQVTPWSAINRWNCSLVYWLPWSEW
jgi:hypothetical protein